MTNSLIFGSVSAATIPVCLAAPDQDDAPLVHINEAFSHLTGYARDEVVGRNCRFLQTGDNRVARIRIRQAVESRKDMQEIFTNQRKSGETFRNLVLISPLFDETGRLMFYLGSQFEITGSSATGRFDAHVGVLTSILQKMPGSYMQDGVLRFHRVTNAARERLEAMGETS